MLEAVPRILLVAYTSTAVLLILKASVLAAATASKRGSLKLFINEEDAEWLKGRYVAGDDERVHRLFRAHRNDLENLLLFFAAGSLYLASGAATIPGVVYCVVFALARFTHTYAYLTRKARLRRDAFTLGWLVNIVMSVHALIAVVAR